jgi:predicted GTPase
VLAIEDGPTLTHGGAEIGAAVIAARAAGATEVVDPRPFLAVELVDTFAKYPHLGAVLPAIGYGSAQVRDLEATLRSAAAGGVEAVAIGTPMDLEVLGTPALADVLAPILRRVRGR